MIYKAPMPLSVIDKVLAANAGKPIRPSTLTEAVWVVNNYQRRSKPLNVKRYLSMSPECFV